MKNKINPEHYKKGKVEIIEVIEDMSFCLGNAIKYIDRCEYKGEKQTDLQKAIWYIKRELSKSNDYKEECDHIDKVFITKLLDASLSDINLSDIQKYKVMTAVSNRLEVIN